MREVIFRVGAGILAALMLCVVWMLLFTDLTLQGLDELGAEQPLPPVVENKS